LLEKMVIDQALVATAAVLAPEMVETEGAVEMEVTVEAVVAERDLAGLYLLQRVVL
jgi:hypothetical protein